MYRLTSAFAMTTARNKWPNIWWNALRYNECRSADDPQSEWRPNSCRIKRQSENKSNKCFVFLKSVCETKNKRTEENTIAMNLNSILICCSSRLLYLTKQYLPNIEHVNNYGISTIYSYENGNL